jgi:hypothetical protein
MMTGARIHLLPADEAKTAASDADVSEYMAGLNIFGPCPQRRNRLSRLSGSLPRHGENAWLRGPYRVGRCDGMTPGIQGGPPALS